MKKSTETLFNAIGGLNDELLDRAIGRSIRANDKTREETAKSAAELCLTGETSAPRPRSKKLLRIGLIAAALVLVLGIGVLGFNKGLAERVIPVDKSETVSTDENGNRVFTKIEVDENAPVTKAELIERALNTVDYYNTVSVTFERYRLGELSGSYTIDANLNTAKAVQTLRRSSQSLESIVSDGETVVTYQDFYGEKVYHIEGAALNRLDEDASVFDTTPRLTITEHGAAIPLFRDDFTNASASVFCINPAREVFYYFNDDESWEITGEIEYLGRKAVEASGTAYLRTGATPDELVPAPMYFCIDKKTGILLKFAVLDEDGDIIDGVTVNEITIDQPEYTDERIDAAIEQYRASRDEYLSREEYQQNQKYENADYHANYVPLAVDPEEETTKDEIYKRMLRTFDYFNTVSVEYSLRSFEDFENEETVTIDTDIKTSKALTSCKAEGIDLLLTSDGTNMLVYDLVSHAKYARNGIGNECISRRDKQNDTLCRSGPMVEFSKTGYDAPGSIPNYSNSQFAPDVLMPRDYAIGFLSDQSLWEITGEKEYLGRKADEIEGVLTKDPDTEYPVLDDMIRYLVEKYGISRFYFSIDKLTGIILELECWDEDGNLIRETKVTALSLDKPEYTDARIEKGLAEGKKLQSSCELKTNNAEVKEAYLTPYYPNPICVKKGESRQYLEFIR